MRAVGDCMRAKTIRPDSEDVHLVPDSWILACIQGRTASKPNGAGPVRLFQCATGESRGSH